MDNDINIIEVLDYINPSTLSYQEWVNVGMALKDDGYSWTIWDEWSQKDITRYRNGECERKWNTFDGLSHNNPVTIGSIIKMAADNGWRSNNGGVSFEWDDIIAESNEKVVDANWIEAKELKEPKSWHPAKELVTYLRTLFDKEDYVGYVTESYEREDGKHIPSKGCYDRTAQQLITALEKCNDDIGSVLGDYNEEAGAWIRFNPLDGAGVKNENVVSFKYALVESDTMDIEKQNAILRELELPIAVLVHSGKKSLHAIVKINAQSYDEYKQRVNYLYEICLKNDLKIDSQNRNPSRLSRMPGIIRNGKKQYIVDTDIGKSTFEEWKEWMEAANDNLPDTESLADTWDNLPELAPPLIDGVLRQGHKMLIAGPSKAGKSYALIEMCIAIAQGKKWFGFNCAQGKVLYVNLELDRASCLHRFKDVYAALGYKPDYVKNIDVWNLRGSTVPMDKLAPKLIRRASKKNYIAVIIDPIYKVITGDENSADQMAKFCNQFDKVCTELGCAVIYCHHHSKGAQGGKRSMDRASGSGVFARDPDALIDLIELPVEQNLLKQQKDKKTINVCSEWLKRFGYADEPSQDDLCSAHAMLELSRKLLAENSYKLLMQDVKRGEKQAEALTAWRIEATLREFPKFAPVNLWFRYPVHVLDESGVLSDIDIDNSVPPWQKNFSKKRSSKERKEDRKLSIETAYEACKIDGEVTLSALSEYMGVTEKTVRNRLKEHGDYWIDDGVVGIK